MLARRKAGWYPRAPLPSPAPRFNAETLERLRHYARQRAESLPPDARQRDALREGRFEFHHAASGPHESPPWRERSHGRLWAYQLHSFAFAPALEADDTPLLARWMRDWIDRNPPGTDIAWDSYCVSNRLLHWALAAAQMDAPDDALCASYAQQTAWLLQSIEWDVRANHLLKNACALAVAGNLLGGDASWQGRQLLEAEVAEQILPDGGHYERSPMYHALVLDDLLLAYASYRDKPVYLRDAIRRMASWLEQVCHPDGGIPLFGDSVFGEAPDTRSLIAFARAVTEVDDVPAALASRALEDSGYYIGVAGASSLHCIVKACGPEPAYQPGHAHADLGSYELSFGSARFVVDTGVHGYAESPWRAHCRSVRAHNCASLGGRQPIDTWGVFRVGRRCTVTIPEAVADDTGLRLRIRHDGFRPAAYARTLTLSESGLEVRDAAQCARDEVLTTRILLHPEVVVTAEGGAFRLERDGHRLWLTAEAGALAHHPPHSSPPEGWYFPEFGRGCPAHRFELTSAPSRSPETCYRISRERPSDVVA